jgi:hypothetical protein
VRETWPLTLRKEHRLRVFKNRVLKRIFDPKRDELTGGWRKLHNEDLDQDVGGWTILSRIWVGVTNNNGFWIR